MSYYIRYLGEDINAAKNNPNLIEVLLPKTDPSILGDLAIFFRENISDNMHFTPYPKKPVLTMAIIIEPMQEPLC